MTFDAASPTVTINQSAAQDDPTGTSSINFTVVVSGPALAFATGDATRSATARRYNVAVSGMTVSGTVIANVSAGVATDSAGNPNAAATSTDKTVTFNIGQPIVLFADSFEVSEWNSLWVEDSQNDWSRSTQRATDGTHSAEVDGRLHDATLTTANVIDLSGMAPATLTFDWLIESGFDSGEYLSLDISTDGGASWQSDVRRLNGNVSQEDVWHSETVDLTPYASSNLKIRFRSKVAPPMKMPTWIT